MLWHMVYKQGCWRDGPARRTREEAERDLAEWLRIHPDGEARVDYFCPTVNGD